MFEDYVVLTTVALLPSAEAQVHTAKHTCKHSPKCMHTHTHAQGADIVGALVPGAESRRRLLRGLAGIWALPAEQAVER